MEGGRRPKSAFKKKNVEEDDEPTDPVENFEKWKKRYNKVKTRVKEEKRETQKPEWQLERDIIQLLVSKYDEINVKDVVNFSDFPFSSKTLKDINSKAITLRARTIAHESRHPRNPSASIGRRYRSLAWKRARYGLVEAKYRQPTEIQKQTIGFALQGKDVLGAAKTGSGKTLAFLIPVMECLYRHQWTAMDGLGALVISPTRELAYQTFEVLRKVGKNHEFSAGLIIGGKDLKSESEKIHRTNIVICTPGRLLQHMDQTATFHASDLHMLVLDEADRILDMGFADTINAIVENLPKTRQTLLFSATQTKSVKDLARLSLKDPEYVWVHEKAKFSTPATLEQNYVVCELHQKVNMLYSFVRSHLQKKIIVFFACCKEVQYLYRVFCRLRPGTPILALHGKQQQMKRVDIYNDFIRKKSAVLFATDIAARGLDFPAVNWVLQYDCPEDANTYIHRVGRTARYKEGGEALLVLLPSEEKGMITQLQEKKVPINKIQVNPDKLQMVQQQLEAFLAQETEQKERAQRCFISYLRSVYLMKNKDVFDVFKLRLQEYALSLGLAVAPRVRFLHKVQKQKAVEESGRAQEQSKEEAELKSFMAKLREGPNAESQSSDDEEEEDDDRQKEEPKALLFGGDDEDDLKDLDLLTVKRKHIFDHTDGGEVKEEGAVKPEKKTEKLTKFKEAKKVLKKNFQVNTKMTFTEEGQVVQQWPPAQLTTVPNPDEEEEEEEEEISGINVEKARERLRLEDQKYDKLEHSRKVKEKHRERRLKARGSRKEASKSESESESEGESEEEDEFVAYLDNDGEEFDPSTLPDPDKERSDSTEEEEEEEEEQSTQAGRSRKRSHSDSSEEEEEKPTQVKSKRGRHQDTLPATQPLDTGLSLAEDEELVLHLLGNQS